MNQENTTNSNKRKNMAESNEETNSVWTVEDFQKAGAGLLAMKKGIDDLNPVFIWGEKIKECLDYLEIVKHCANVFMPLMIGWWNQFATWYNSKSEEYQKEHGQFPEDSKVVEALELYPELTEGQINVIRGAISGYNMLQIGDAFSQIAEENGLDSYITQYIKEQSQYNDGCDYCSKCREEKKSAESESTASEPGADESAGTDKKP